MPGVWSQLRARGVASVQPSDAASLAADMAAHPEDYAIPQWALSLWDIVKLLRSQSERAVQLKRKIALVLLLAGGAAFALRMWHARQVRLERKKKFEQLAHESAARGDALVAVPPSTRERRMSLGDRLVAKREPVANGQLPVDGKSAAVGQAAGKAGTKHRVAVDALFFSRLRRILAITIPGVWSKEAAYLSILTGLLFARTFFSIAIAEIVGANAQSLVSRRWGRMWHGVKMFAIITIPASAVNAGLKYFTELVSLRFRKRLSEHVTAQYLDGTNFYKACNLGGESRIDNADQRIVADIKDFGDEIASLYASLLKPLLDVVLFTWKLSTLLGWQGPAAMHGYFLFSAFVKKRLMPNLGRLVARESELEGFYRTAHNRLITNSEEVAFYDGSQKEKKIINNALQLICQHIAYARYVKAWIGVFDGLLIKYYASIAGYCTLLSPFILNMNSQATTSELTRDYIRTSQYLGQLSTAVAALVMTGNKLTSIAGYTSRVSELLEQVRHLNEAGNQPFEIKAEAPHIREQVAEGSELANTIDSWRKRCDQQREQRINIRHTQGESGASQAAIAEREQKQATATLMKRTHSHTGLGVGGGEIELADDIEFIHVDIVSPEGKLLVHDLNFTVTAGTNVMVTGPNGVGKSSLFRIIGELWPLHSGVLRKPAKEEIMFIPQKPYLVLGTLRDQIIYPHERADMEALGVTDEDLGALLAIVDPARNITTEWEWDTVKDWFHAFSGGQKQRVAMARLFYHKPKFAILDECTSAVSDEVEGTIYSTCRLLGITIFTVSHRPSLAKYHDVVLKFLGETRWTTTKIDSRAEIEREKKERAQLTAGDQQQATSASSASGSSGSAAASEPVASAAAASTTAAVAASEQEEAASGAASSEDGVSADASQLSGAADGHKDSQRGKKKHGGKHK